MLLGCLYGVAGERDKAEQVLDQFQELNKKQHVLRGDFGLVYAGMGELERAFAWLEQAYEQREEMLVVLKDQPASFPDSARPASGRPTAAHRPAAMIER